MKRIKCLMLTLIMMLTTVNVFAGTSDDDIVLKGKTYNLKNVEKYDKNELIQMLLNSNDKINIFIKVNNENTNESNAPKETNSKKSWKVLKEQVNVPLDKSWTLDVKNVGQVEAVVIQREFELEKGNVSVPVRIQMMPTAKQIIVTPLDSYIPGEKYSLRLFYEDGTKEILHFTTISYDDMVNDKEGNSNGNVVNYGLAVERAGWIYYSNFDDKGKLYKMASDGENKTKLSDDENVEYINVLNGWVYYSFKTSDSNRSVVKIRTNGLDRRIDNKEYESAILDLKVVDRDIYFIKKYRNKRYSFIADELQKSDMNFKNSTRIVNSTTDLNVNGNFTYCIDDGNIIKYNMKTEIDEKFETNAKYLVVEGNWMYYINSSDSRVYKTKTDFSTTICLTEKDIVNKGLNVHNGWVYYVNDADRFIYRIKTDGTERQQINSAPSKYINITGERIYFMNPDDNKLYQMELDGKNLKKL